MQRKTENEVLTLKLKKFNWYRLLMVLFLVGTIIGSTFAIIKSVQFTNYKNTFEHPDWIGVVIQTRKFNDTQIELPEQYQLNPSDYGGAKVKGDWKGKTLDEFLHSYPLIFHFADSGYVDGIKGTEKGAFSKKWMLYSATDPKSIEHPDQPTTIGAPSMYLQDNNVFYFALSLFS